MQQITDFIVENLKSMGFAVLYLVVGLFFLPDSIILFIIEFKKGVVNKIKEPYLELVKTLISLYIKGDAVDLQNANDVFRNNIKYYLDQNDNIDKNIYVIDLCKDIVASLSYARVGASVYDGIFEYLNGYYNGFVPLDQEEKFIDNMTDKLLEFGEKLSIKPDLNCIRQFSDFLKKEKQKLEDLKNKNKEKMIDLIKAKINE